MNGGQSLRDAVESILKGVEPSIEREDRHGEGSSSVNAFVGSAAEVESVASLQPGIGNVDGVAQVGRDLSHDSPSLGDSAASTADIVVPIVDAPLNRFSPAIWTAAVAYVVVGIAVAWLAFVLAPWGLLILIVAFGALGASVICGLMAAGIAMVEEDERRPSVGEVVRNAHRVGSVDDLGEHLDRSPECIELRTVAQPDMLTDVPVRRLPDDGVLTLKPGLDRRENLGRGGACAHGDNVHAGAES